MDALVVPALLLPRNVSDPLASLVMLEPASELLSRNDMELKLSKKMFEAAELLSCNTIEPLLTKLCLAPPPLCIPCEVSVSEPVGVIEKMYCVLLTSGNVMMPTFTDE